MSVNVLTPKRIASFAALFVLARLRRGSKSWADYGRGKRLLVGLLPDEYERGIAELARYLCL